MDNRCTQLINKVLFEDHTQSEWHDLKLQFETIASTSTKEELDILEESGIGEILHMICS